MLYLTLRHYEYVTAIARHGSLSGAASALHVSQPALSAALARIEAHLGRVLFLRRKGAALALTPQGREFVTAAEALLSEAARLEHAGTGAAPQGRLVLGCFRDLAPFLLPRALRVLRQTLPGVELDLLESDFEDLIAAQLSGACDLALTWDLGLDSSFTRQELYRVTPQALMPPDHSLAARAEVSLSDLATEPLILSREGLSIAHMMRLFRGAGLVPAIAHRAASLELLRSLAASGEGIGLAYSLPQSDHSYEGLPLIARPLAAPQAVEPVVLTCHADPAPHSLTARAMAALTQAFKKDATERESEDQL
jgi:DNA-binding transcriptional LysR family regulator